jgi:hypothetical protein
VAGRGAAGWFAALTHTFASTVTLRVYLAQETGYKIGDSTSGSFDDRFRIGVRSLLRPWHDVQPFAEAHLLEDFGETPLLRSSRRTLAILIGLNGRISLGM